MSGSVIQTVWSGSAFDAQHAQTMQAVVAVAMPIVSSQSEHAIIKGMWTRRMDIII